MAQEEEVLGKAYDSRLMRRLLTYLRPYRWQVTVAIVSIVLKSFCDVLGPYLVKVAVDRYLAPAKGTTSGLWSWLSPQPLHGIAQLSTIYFGLLLCTFLFEFLQTYFMQWTGQKVMFDLRSQIFRHLQRMHVAFYDKNPVGRLVTRVTTDVDALNEMFTSGVVSIFEDLFVLVGILGIMLCMNWKLALITFAVLPLIVVATKIFRDKVRDSYRRIRTAIARINSYLQEHVSGMVVLQLFNREQQGLPAILGNQPQPHGRLQRRDPGLLALLSRGGFFLGDRDCLRDLVRRPGYSSRSHLQQHLGRVQPPDAVVVPCGRDRGIARRGRRLHAIRAALLPPHHGLQREIQHSPVRDGGQRTHLQTAGYASRYRLSRSNEEARRPRPHRI